MIALIMVACLTVFLPVLNPAHGRHGLQSLTILGLDGRPLAPAAWDKSPVLLNFWSPDCAACLTELPVFQDAYRRGDLSGLSVVGVALSSDDPHRAAAAAALSQVTYPQAWDATGQLDRALGGIRVVPTTVLMERDGRLLFRQEGALTIGELQALAQAYGVASDSDLPLSRVGRPMPSNP